MLYLVERLKIQDLVDFPGNCQTVWDSIAAFDIFIMPSISEGFGIAALEAQAAGLPCLVSTGIPDEVDMGLGLIKRIEPQDVKDWAKSINSFRPVIPNSDTIIRSISKRGYDSATECEKITRRYFDIVEGKTK